MKQSLSFLLSVLILFFGLCTPTHTVFAQGADTSTKEGLTEYQLLIQDGDTVKTTSLPYDPKLYGIVVNDNGQIHAVQTGNVKMIVTDQNGDVQVGDFITSSSIPGMGMKATQSGTVAGTVVEILQDQGMIEYRGMKVRSELITVSLGIKNQQIHQVETKKQPKNNALLDFLRSTIKKVPYLQKQPHVDSAISLLHYGSALILGILLILIIISYYGRILLKGVEAMGRNPRASTQIKLSMALSILFAMTLSLLGLFLIALVLAL